MKIQNKILIGGFHKQSLIDYPDNISAVIFTCGCNFSCNYCHNPQLIDSDLKDHSNRLSEEVILNWINKNSQMLDAVVITGGEPTLHSSLPSFIQKIKKFGIKVKLDTNGTNPDMLEKLIADGLVDYVAMDIKAPLSLMRYRKVVGDILDDPLLKKVMQSVKILNRKLIDCEFRTTADESLSVDDFIAIAGEISGKYYIQHRTDRNSASIKTAKIENLKEIKAKMPADLNLFLRG